MSDHANRPSKAEVKRPMWQRLVLPILGLLLIAIGIVGWIIPIIPGFPLIIIGIPLLFAFSGRMESKIRTYFFGMIKRLSMKIHKRNC